MHTASSFLLAALWVTMERSARSYTDPRWETELLLRILRRREGGSKVWSIGAAVFGGGGEVMRLGDWEAGAALRITGLGSLS